MIIILIPAVAAALVAAGLDWLLRTFTTLPTIVKLFLVFLALLLVYGSAPLTIGTR